MNSKVIKVYNLPKDKTILYRLEVKPFFILTASFIIGIMIIYSFTSLGIILIGTGLFGFFFMPSKVLLEFTDEYLILYNRASKNDCVIVYYNEIVTWQYLKTAKEDWLIIDLEDGRVEKLECFNRFMVCKYLNEFAKDKQIKAKRGL